MMNSRRLAVFARANAILGRESAAAAAPAPETKTLRESIVTSS
jgi:hypothetical protein